MATLTADQQQLIQKYLENWPDSLALYTSSPPTDSGASLQLSHQGRIATITAEDLLEGLAYTPELTGVPPYLLASTDNSGLYHAELPFRIRNNAALTVNPPEDMNGTSITYRIGPSAFLIAARPEIVQNAMLTLGTGTIQSIFDIDDLKHGILEAEGTDKGETLSLLKASISWIGRVAAGQPLEFILYSDDSLPPSQPIIVDLPPVTGIDCRTPMDYFLYGITSRRRVASYLAFYHVLEFYMGEIEVSQLQAAIKIVYGNNHRITDRDFAVTLMHEFTGLTKKQSSEADLLDACFDRIPDTVIRQIVQNRASDLPAYTTEFGLVSLTEAIEFRRDGKSSFSKESPKWNAQNLRSQLSKRVYSFRNGLVHSKSSEKTNISLQTLESADWVVFEIGLMRDVAYALLSVNAP